MKTPLRSCPPQKRWGGRFFALACCVIGALAGTVSALPDTPALAPAPRRVTPKFVAPKLNNIYEVLVFANQRPVRIRVTALSDGKPMDELWRDRLKKLFEFCDRNNNGSLSEEESKFSFSDLGMSQLLANGYYQPVSSNTPSFSELDKDGDGKISFEEFVASFPRTTAQIFRSAPVQPDNTNNAVVTEAVFKLLDVNGDGKLTQDEVNSVEKLLASRDTDEDECLNMGELVPNLYDQRFGRAIRFAQPNPPNGNPYSVNAGSQTAVIYPAGLIPGTVTQKVIQKYDKNGDFDLTPEECGFDATTFKALDTNGNGKLDGEELDVWRTGAPDMDITLTVASKAKECSAKLADKKSVEARGFNVKQVEDGRLVLHVGRQRIDIWSFAPIAQYSQGPLKQQFGYLFTQAAGAKDYVEEKDLGGQNAVQLQFIRVIFEPADRDGNGKLTKAEFDAYFDLQDSFRNLSLSLTPGIQTPSLFQLLDENRDGRLGVRELRTAWKRLVVLEDAKADVITKNIIQPSITLHLSRSFNRFYINQAVQLEVGNPNQVVFPQKGPLWFRKMDRNGDGDVSRAEFLGSKAEFDAIDTDHDDLIGLEEAEAFDKNLREKENGSAVAQPEKPKPDRKEPEKPKK